MDAKAIYCEWRCSNMVMHRFVACVALLGMVRPRKWPCMQTLPGRTLAFVAVLRRVCIRSHHPPIKIPSGLGFLLEGLNG